MEMISVKRFVAKGFHTAEAMKTLRTNLMFTGDNVRVIALTSFSASEGKTSIAFQLAASLAQAGKRVLLMDTDLRRSVLINRLQVKAKIHGLSHYLSGMANVSDLLCETDLPGFYIMFAGARVATPAEILGGSQFKKLIPALRKTFDYVIVDTPPLGQVIDCAVMAPEMDGVLMVVDTTHNSYKFERRILSQIQKSGGKVLGVVLNRVDLSDRRSYYGKAYGYGSYGGYGYGYGYGYSEEPAEETTEEK